MRQTRPSLSAPFFQVLSSNPRQSLRKMDLRCTGTATACRTAAFHHCMLGLAARVQSKYRLCHEASPSAWHVDTMGGVCRLWSQHIAVDEPLRSQTCQVKFANCRCVCEPSNRVCQPPVRSLRTMTGACEPNKVSTRHKPKAGGTANFREWIYTILSTIQTPSVWPWWKSLLAASIAILASGPKLVGRFCMGGLAWCGAFGPPCWHNMHASKFRMANQQSNVKESQKFLSWSLSTKFVPMIPTGKMGALESESQATPQL